LEEITAAEAHPAAGTVSPRPFVLFVQPSLFDPTRAPGGSHTAWAYCHVPNGSREDMTSRIEAQVERFAPGFSKLILARHAITPAEFEQMNPNYTGGDIIGGAQSVSQLFLRPNRRLYKTPLKGVYLCSAATPPGGGVHGMCGYWAAKWAASR
jgi:phytoene dehydrogenase-like protein